MKEAMHWKALNGGKIKCGLCPRYCLIKEGCVGNCGVRKNIKGKLFSLVYGKVCSAGVDPIEKKPLFHFLPGSRSFSIATAGCNLHCLHCQNWGISQASPEDVPGEKMEPEEIVRGAVSKGCKSISYTYTEPTVFYEYVLDTAKIARKKGIRNVLVSNGYINPEPLKEICKYIDAANIDLKGDDRFYEEVCGVKDRKPVLESLKILKKEGIHTEVTYLIIPTYNDSRKEIEETCRWIGREIGRETPVHFSRFFPMHEMEYVETTPRETLEMAREIGKKYLDFVYVGNIFVDEGEDTICPKCGKILIHREGYDVAENEIKNGKCKCGHKIAGVWK
jgi:pyruvate formate lyase activating enzyme